MIAPRRSPRPHAVPGPARSRLATLLLGIVAFGCRPAADPLTVDGTVEVHAVDVAPMAPGRVARVVVDEGAAVRAGDTLAVLTQTSLPASIDAARARVASAEATLRDLRAGSRPEEIAQAAAALAQAEADDDRASRDLVRTRELAERQVVPAQQLDRADADARAARARRDAAAQAFALAKAGSRVDRVTAAEAEAAAARAQLAQVQAGATDLAILAPVGGIVLTRVAEPGDVLGAGAPVMTIGETARPWVRIFLPARVVASLRTGDRADVALAGAPGRTWPGRVSSIAARAEFTPRTALSEDERADLLFGVKVEVLDTTRTLKPGLPAVVTVKPGSAPADTLREGR